MLQPENTESPIVVTESGISTVAKELQSEKAELPIEVTESGIVTEVKLLQPLNVESPMEVIESGISIVVKELHPENVELPREVTELGISTVAKSLHPENAECPIVVCFCKKDLFRKLAHTGNYFFIVVHYLFSKAEVCVYSSDKQRACFVWHSHKRMKKNRRKFFKLLTVFKKFFVCFSAVNYKWKIVLNCKVQLQVEHFFLCGSLAFEFFIKVIKASLTYCVEFVLL